MKTKHTKGPWENLDTELTEDKIIITSKERAICSLSYKDDAEYSEVYTNANLIAAAPEMLEALEFIWKSSGHTLGDTARLKITDALKKAKGE